MIDFIMGNLATIIVGAVLALVLILTIVKMIKDKKQGKSSCSCGCGGCPMASQCHSSNKEK